MQALLLRLASALASTWTVATLVFCLTRAWLGAPDLTSTSQERILTGPVGANDQVRQSQRRRLGLDQPVFYVGFTGDHWRYYGPANQYQHWLTQLAHGELGRSWRDDRPVGDHYAEALAFTVPLTGAALLLAVGGALTGALYLAGGPPTLPRRLLRGLLTALDMTPLVLVATALLLLLANPDALNLLPGASDVAREGVAGGPGLGYWLARAVLPLLVLVVGVLPELTLPLAASLAHELTTPYLRAARAKGLSLGQLLRRHALPNAALPLLNSVAALLPSLLGGSLVVEVVFALPGSGRLVAQAAATHDLPVLEAGIILIAGARFAAQLLADAAQHLLDPRIAV